MADDVHEHLAQLGAQLRHARMQAGLTLEDVGQRAGVSRQLLSKIESGHPHGEIGAVAAVASALNYRLAVAPRKKPNRGEQGALDLIARLRSAPADLQ